MKTLLTGGTVVTMDGGDLARGDVLIEDGVIVRVAERIDATDADRIDATDRIVLPGFVDTHRHTWQTAFRGIGADWTFAEYRVAMHGTLKPHYRPEDIYLGNLLGRLEALSSGVTTMLDWFHAAQSPEHTDAALAALTDAPARSIFCYGGGMGGGDPVDDTELRRIRDQIPGGLVTMALGLRGPQLTTMDVVATDLKLADELGLRSSVHVGSGGARGSRPIAAFHERGLLSDTITFVHANGVDDDELRMMADAGSSVSISPDVELKMGFGWPPACGPRSPSTTAPRPAATCSPPCAPPTPCSAASTATCGPGISSNSPPSTALRPVECPPERAVSRPARTPMSSCCAPTT
jgi:5-methylthioadenosine/S-adenosylhomocysteine deaminase